MAPSTTIGEIFTTVYALAGVASLGIAIGVLGTKMLQSQGGDNAAAVVPSARERPTVRTMFNGEAGDERPTPKDDEGGQSKPHERHCKQVTFDDSDHGSIDGHRQPSANAPLPCGRKSAMLIDKRRSYDFSLLRFMLLVGTTLAFAFAIGVDAGWSFWDVIYYAVVTGCTIGYGDLAPETQRERFLAVIFIPLSCAVTGHFLAYFARYVMERQSADYRRRNFEAHGELTVDDLRAMDISGDGKVAWYEFLEFMLVAMKKVDPELLDELRGYFDRLDVSHTGELSQEDLIEMARRKLRCPRRKLELSTYKHHLLKLGRERRKRRPTPPPHMGYGWLSSRFFGGLSVQDLDDDDDDGDDDDDSNDDRDIGFHRRGDFAGLPRLRRINEFLSLRL